MVTKKYTLFIKQLFSILGREEKIDLINRSSLTDKERDVMYNRYIKGSFAKEEADRINLSIDGFEKYQQKIFCKFYTWMTTLSDFEKYINFTLIIHNLTHNPR